MKKVVGVLVLLLALSGCGPTPSSADSVTSLDSTSIDDSTSTNSQDSAPISIDNNFFKDDVNLSIQGQEKLIELNSRVFDAVGTYSTGNYVNIYSGPIYVAEGVNFEYYRAVKNASEMVTLLPYFANAEDGTIPGALYNSSALNNITRMIIDYSNNSVSSEGFAFSYSNDNYNFTTHYAPSSTTSKMVEVDLDNPSYFKIEAISQQVILNRVYIYYTGNAGTRDSYSSGLDEVRLNPTTVNATLVPGVTSVEVPIEVEVLNNGSYEIKETKEYTYYDYNYVLSHPEVADDAAMTSPEDIAAYVIAFKRVPANFVYTYDSTTSAFNLFGQNLRKYSEWNRTDGYVNSFPLDKTRMYYIEFDVDIGNTYIDETGDISRGVGRVVIFMNGFNQQGYNDSPVAVFTDDHYSTFQEYLNIGHYGRRFSGQSYRNGFSYGSPTILNPFNKPIAESWTMHRTTISSSGVTSENEFTLDKISKQGEITQTWSKSQYFYQGEKILYIESSLGETRLDGSTFSISPFGEDIISFGNGKIIDVDGAKQIEFIDNGYYTIEVRHNTVSQNRYISIHNIGYFNRITTDYEFVKDVVDDYINVQTYLPDLDVEENCQFQINNEYWVDSIDSTVTINLAMVYDNASSAIESITSSIIELGYTLYQEDAYVNYYVKDGWYCACGVFGDVAIFALTNQNQYTSVYY